MQQLKAYCHTDNTIALRDAPLECREVSFLASPAALRELAGFLLRCADRFDVHLVDTPDHFHLRDEWKIWTSGESADVIAVSVAAQS